MSDEQARPLVEAARTLISGGTLDQHAAQRAVEVIIEGTAADSDIAAFLASVHQRGETEAILAGAVSAVRARMVRFDLPQGLRPVHDTCGTGGDHAHTFNVSTATAIVLAACGQRVTKHGNRASTSRSGSADVLAELGVRIDAPPPVLSRCMEELGIAFLFAPAFHPALRHAAAARKSLPHRTLFNLVGPLVNPAAPDRQLIGAPTEPTAELIVRTLTLLHASQTDAPKVALVVSSSDGLDEVSLGGESRVRVVEGGELTADERLTAAEFGLPAAAIHALRVDGPNASASTIRAVLAGAQGPARDSVVANAALLLADPRRLRETLPSAVVRVQEAIDSGAASRLLESWAALSHTQP